MAGGGGGPSLLGLSGAYSKLLDYVLFAALLFHMRTAIGLFGLRFTRPTAERAVRAPGYPWLPALYVVVTAAISADLLIEKVTRTYSALGFGLVLLGVPVYFGWRALVNRARLSPR